MIVNQEYGMVAVDAVQPHPDNPRRGDTDAIAASIEANGFYGALLVQRSTGHILVGSHRWQAARDGGETELPALTIDCDDATAARILLADNRTSELAGWDDAALLALLQQVEETDPDALLGGTGFGPAEVAALAADLAAVPDQVPDDADPAARRKRMLESYEGTRLRQVVLVYPPAEYEPLVLELEGLRAGMGAASFAAVVAQLVHAAAAPVEAQAVAP